MGKWTPAQNDFKKVIVALARKLTTLMLIMWKSETGYNERLNAIN